MLPGAGALPDSPRESVVEGASIGTVLNHASLAEQADSAVRVHVESASEYLFLDVPHTLSRVRVLDTLAGRDFTGQTLEIVQVGTASAPMEGLARPLREGSEHAFYTAPIFLEPGAPTDRWVVVAQGIWRLTATSAFDLDIATGDLAAFTEGAVARLDDLDDAQLAGAFRTQVWDLELTASPEGLAASVADAWAP